MLSPPSVSSIRQCSPASLAPPRRKEQRAQGTLHASRPDRAFFLLLSSKDKNDIKQEHKENRGPPEISSLSTRTHVGRVLPEYPCMGLLDQLWDDTVAGPRPDSGLGKLRKYASFSPSSSSSSAPAPSAISPAPAAEGAVPPPPPAVTRSITMLRPAALSVVTSPRSESSSAPSSPASASGAPDSPFGAATTPKGEGWKKLRRKGRMGDGGADAPGTPRSPTVYDWVVISSLDR